MCLPSCPDDLVHPIGIRGCSLDLSQAIEEKRRHPDSSWCNDRKKVELLIPEQSKKLFALRFPAHKARDLVLEVGRQVRGKPPPQRGDPLFGRFAKVPQYC